MTNTTISKLCTKLRKSEMHAHEPISVNEYLKDKPHNTILPSYSIPEDFSCLLLLYTKEGLEMSISHKERFVLKHEVPSTGIYHKHAYIEILYVVDGTFSQILLGEKLCFEAGEFVITDQNCEHADILATQDATVLFLRINPRYLDLLLHHYDHHDDLQHFLFHSLRIQKKEQSFLELKSDKKIICSQMEELLARLYQEDITRQIGYSEIRKGLLLRIFHLLCSEYSLQLHSNSLERKEKSTLYEIERYIHMHPALATTSNLEKEFHYHRNYYNLLLKKYYGKTFRQYVADIRMNYACQLLKQTSLTVKEIASQVGYENTSFFYHQFEDCFGCSPSEYRNK